MQSTVSSSPKSHKTTLYVYIYNILYSLKNKWLQLQQTCTRKHTIEIKRRKHLYTQHHFKLPAVCYPRIATSMSTRLRCTHVRYTVRVTTFFISLLFRQSAGLDSLTLSAAAARRVFFVRKPTSCLLSFSASPDAADAKKFLEQLTPVSAV